MKKSILTAALLSLSTLAMADPGVVSLSASSQSEVENDQMEATLFYEVESKDPNSVSEKLSVAANNALQKAKSYQKDVSVRTNIRTYPVYGEKSKITAWRGRSELTLKSTDLQKINQLMTNLQNPYLIDRVNFSVSDDRLQEVHNSLIDQTANNFDARAQAISKAFGANGYKIKEVNLSFNQPGYQGPIMYAAKSMRGMESDAAMSQPQSSGQSTVSVTANGSVTLTP